MNTLERISAALDDDENYFANNQISLNQKSDLVYVNNHLLLKKDIASYTTENDIIINNFTNYQSIASIYPRKTPVRSEAPTDWRPLLPPRYLKGGRMAHGHAMRPQAYSLRWFRKEPLGVSGWG